jgi:uncharacterized C2H2 Zn-finger protein
MSMVPLFLYLELTYHSGDKFQIELVSFAFNLINNNQTSINCETNSSLFQDELRDGEEIARCPSCSLIIRIIYNPVCLVRENEAYAFSGGPARRRGRRNRRMTC